MKVAVLLSYYENFWLVICVFWPQRTPGYGEIFVQKQKTVVEEMTAFTSLWVIHVSCYLASFCLGHDHVPSQNCCLVASYSVYWTGDGSGSTGGKKSLETETPSLAPLVKKQMFVSGCRAQKGNAGRCSCDLFCPAVLETWCIMRGKDQLIWKGMGKTTSTGRKTLLSSTSTTNRIDFYFAVTFSDCLLRRKQKVSVLWVFFF